MSARRSRPPRGGAPRGRRWSCGCRARRCSRRRSRTPRCSAGTSSFGIVREDEHRVARAERHALQRLVGPGLDRVGVRREARRGEERLARVGDRDAVADALGERRERGREVDRPEDDHARRLGVGGDVDAQAGAQRRAVLAERADGAAAVAEEAARLALDVALQQRGPAEASRRGARGRRTACGPRGRRPAAWRRRPGARRARASSAAIVTSRASSRSSWTKTWTIPPHMRPTVPASSSEIPYVLRRGAPPVSMISSASCATALSTHPPVIEPSTLPCSSM